MKKAFIYAIAIYIILISGLCRIQQVKCAMIKNSDSYNVIMKRDMLCLMMAYQGYIDGIEQREDGSVYLVMNSGKHILYDDGRTKNHEGKLSYPDLQDMMEQIYSIQDIKNLADENFDPGRARVYALLYEVYGSTKKQIESNLTNVKTMGGYFRFNKNNGACESLQKAFNKLAPLVKSNWRIGSSVFPLSGTFNYRNIAGTGRLSPHSFGIAIDLARDSRDYWKWASRREGQKRLESYPREIVSIFENHNFIWGGKWGHFDILHFEYRPEIIYKARYFGGEPAKGQCWYDGVPLEDPLIKSYVDKIEKAL